MDKLERRIGKFAQSYLSGLNFSYDKVGEFYRRDHELGHDAIYIVNHGGQHACATLGSTSAVAVFCAIRLNKVEVPFNMLGLFHGEENQARTHTLTMGFPRGRNVCPPVVPDQMSDEDVENFVAELKNLTADVFLPFFRKYSDGAAIEELANSKPLSDLGSFTIGGPMEHRAMRGLILAKLENPARYDLVKATFVELDKGMFPREQRMAMLNKIDQMVFH